ncbi:MAG: hypothetical protein IRY86_08055 [Thermorudis peleae]|nr:hypothetical protein [Thermorudis peleae]
MARALGVARAACAHQLACASHAGTAPLEAAVVRVLAHGGPGARAACLGIGAFAAAQRWHAAGAGTG